MADQEVSRRHATWTLLALTVLGGLLRSVGLAQQLWYDEITTVLNTIRIPFGQLLCSYTWDNQHTLYSVLAQLAVGVFGETPWALRLPAMLAGTLSIPALYLLGRSVMSRRESLCAAGLLAVSYHHIWFSQNARGYTLLMLATVISTWCFIEGQRCPRLRIWSLYAFTVALGAYAHLTMVFVAVSHMMIVIAQWLWASYRGAEKRSLGWAALAIVASGVITIVFYAPMMSDLVEFYTADRPKVDSEWTKVSWAIQEALRGLQVGYGLLMLVGLVAISAVGVWRFMRTSPVVMALIVLPGLLGLAVMMAAGRNIWPRFFLYVFGNALLVVVHGVWGVAIAASAYWQDPDQRARWATRLGFGLCGLALVQSLRMLPPLYQLPKQDILGAIELVEHERQPQDAVVTLGLASIVIQPFYQADWLAVERVEELDGILNEGQRVWLVTMFPIHLQSRHADFTDRLEREFRTYRTFPATVGGGQVQVSIHDPSG